MSLQVKNFKKGIITVFILDVIFSYLITAVSLENVIAPFTERVFYFLPVIIIVPSFLLAIIIIVFFYKEGTENKIQYYCQLTGLLVAFFILSFQVVKSKINKYKNEAVQLSIEESPKEFQKALEVVKNRFDTTVKVSMHSYWFANEDPETIQPGKAPYAIYFSYFLYGDTTKEYFSKLVPQGSSYKIEVFNGNADSSDELKSWKQEVDNGLRNFDTETIKE